MDFHINTRGDPNGNDIRNFIYLRQIPSFEAEEPPPHVSCNILKGTRDVKTQNQTQGDDNGVEDRFVIVTKDLSLVKMHSKDISHQ